MNETRRGAAAGPDVRNADTCFFSLTCQEHGEITMVEGERVTTILCTVLQEQALGSEYYKSH